MSKKSEGVELAGCLFGLAYLAVTVPFMSVLYGWTTAKLWSWFVVPVFALPQLRVPYAIGLGIVVRLLTYQGDASHSDEDKSIYESLIIGTVKGVLLCGLSLGTGLVVLQFTK